MTYERNNVTHIHKNDKRTVTDNHSFFITIRLINQAIHQMFANQGKDYALGIKLPSLLQQLGFENLQIINDVPIVAGNSDIATLMKLSARQLALQLHEWHSHQRIKKQLLQPLPEVFS